MTEEDRVLKYNPTTRQWDDVTLSFTSAALAKKKHLLKKRRDSEIAAVLDHAEVPPRKRRRKNATDATV